MTTMPAVRTDRQFRKGGKRFQDVFVDGLELRKEVKEGRTFKNLADYLIKYHGYKHFDLVAGYGKRIEKEWYSGYATKESWSAFFRLARMGKFGKKRRRCECLRFTCPSKMPITPSEKCCSSFQGPLRWTSRNCGTYFKSNERSFPKK